MKKHLNRAINSRTAAVAKAIVVVATGLTGGCSLDVGDTQTSECGVQEQQEAIRNGSRAAPADLIWKSTVGVLTMLSNNEVAYCSGTIVSSNYVLTAAHCNPILGKTWVQYYWGAYPSASSAWVTAIFTKPGVVRPDKLYDNEGNFADLALMKLDRPIPNGHVPAELPLPDYFNSTSTKWSGGCGSHDGVVASGRELRWVADQIVSPNDDWGYFYLNGSYTNGGDSGGPVFEMNYGNLRLLGVLWGEELRPGSFSSVAKYTSVAHSSHLTWILSSLWW
jgi:hypothetical protein